jgi:predicted nucleic acid-binding protein
VDYFDTSALLPYYRPESLSGKVESMLLAATEPVAISCLVEVEIASAVSRLVRMKELDGLDATRIQNAFSADIKRGYFQFLMLDSSVYRQARQWLLERESPLRTLDALHLACAALNEARLVTADQVLAVAAETHGVAALYLIDR